MCAGVSAIWHRPGLHRERRLHERLDIDEASVGDDVAVTVTAAHHQKLLGEKPTERVFCPRLTLLRVPLWAGVVVHQKLNFVRGHSLPSNPRATSSILMRSTTSSSGSSPSRLISPPGRRHSLM